KTIRRLEKELGMPLFDGLCETDDNIALSVKDRMEGIALSNGDSRTHRPGKHELSSFKARPKLSELICEPRNRCRWMPKNSHTSSRTYFLPIAGHRHAYLRQVKCLKWKELFTHNHAGRRSVVCNGV